MLGYIEISLLSEMIEYQLYILLSQSGLRKSSVVFKSIKFFDQPMCIFFNVSEYRHQHTLKQNQFALCVDLIGPHTLNFFFQFAQFLKFVVTVQLSSFKTQNIDMNIRKILEANKALCRIVYTLIRVLKHCKIIYSRRGRLLCLLKIQKQESSSALLSLQQVNQRYLLHKIYYKFCNIIKNLF